MRDAAPEPLLRTTIAIDDDVLTAAKTIARQRNQTIGKVVSELARHSLQPSATGAERNGVPFCRYVGKASSSPPRSSMRSATSVREVSPRRQCAGRPDR